MQCVSGRFILHQRFGRGDLKLNGNPVQKHSIAPMAQGSVIKDASGHAIFFSDVVQCCSTCDRIEQRMNFEAKDVAHFFNYPLEAAFDRCQSK